MNDTKCGLLHRGSDESNSHKDAILFQALSTSLCCLGVRPVCLIFTAEWVHPHACFSTIGVKSTSDKLVCTKMGDVVCRLAKDVCRTETAKRQTVGLSGSDGQVMKGDQRAATGDTTKHAVQQMSSRWNRNVRFPKTSVRAQIRLVSDA